MATPHERWFAETLRAGIETKLLNEQDILNHATPAVLTTSLPRDVMVRVIDTTLASGTMSHKAIVDVVTLDLLAEKVPNKIVWACIAQASERGGVRDGIPKDEAPSREWCRRTLAAGLSNGVILPANVTQHVTAQVLVQSIPEALTVKLLETSLKAGKMSPDIIVETIGVDAIAKYVATNIVWAIFVKPGESEQTALAMPVAAKPKMEVFNDDDVHNVLVELDADLDAIPAPTPTKAPVVAQGSRPVGKTQPPPVTNVKPLPK